MNPLRAELDAIIAEYRGSLPSKMDCLDALLAAGDVAALTRELHTLAGSAGTFGLPQLGAAARAAEELLARDASGARRDELERLLGALRHEACKP